MELGGKVCSEAPSSQPGTAAWPCVLLKRSAVGRMGALRGGTCESKAEPNFCGQGTTWW